MIALVTIFLFAGLASATTYDSLAVTEYDVTGAVTYSGSWTISDSASGAIYQSKAMLLSPLAGDYGYGYFKCSEVGTEDINVFFEYSNDLSTWTAGTTDTDLDAVGTTAVLDTIGYVAAAQEYLYKTRIWFRLKAVVGQNMNATTFSWEVSFRKPAGLERVKLSNTTYSQ